MMFDIGEEELLVRVHRYELQRTDGRVTIELHEVLEGKAAHRFVAIPRISFSRAEKEYCGSGDTDRSALMDCLKRIKGVPVEVLVPPPK